MDGFSETAISDTMEHGWAVKARRAWVKAQADLKGFLSERERELRVIADAVPEMVCLFDCDWRYRFVNRSYAERFGLEPHEFIGRPVEALAGEDAVAKARPYFEKVMRGEPVQFEAEIEYKRVGWRLIRVSYTPDIDAQGRVHGVVAVITDTTERRLLEAERLEIAASHARTLAVQTMRAESQKFQTILESLSESVVVADGAGRLVYLNRAAREFFGEGAEGTPQDDWVQKFGLYGEDGVTPLSTRELPLVRAIGGEMVRNVRMVARNLHGKFRHVTVSASPLQSEDGVRRGGVIIVRDITDRHRTEAALQESEERFRNAFESAAVGMYLVGLDGRWLKVNDKLCQMVGRSQDEMLATTFQAITHPDDLKEDLINVRQLLDGEVQHYTMEKRYIHKDGHVVWILLGGALVRDHAGTPLYFVGHVQDISRRKAAEERLVASLAEKEILLREIHHRVKNNLQVVSSLLELQASSLDEAAARPLRDSQRRVQAMALIHELLHGPWTSADVNLGEYVRRLAGSVHASLAMDPGVQLEMALEPVSVSVDQAVPLGLVVNELLSNALTHAFPVTFEGPRRLQVRLWREAPGVGVLEVCDNGVGYDPAISQPSLGLNLVRRLAKQAEAVTSTRTGPAGTTVRTTFSLNGDGVS